MASFTGTKIKDTYKSILKVSDNGELDAAEQEITDGAGNGTGVSLNTSGDVSATGTVSFGSLKDSGENITVTKFVDEADGIANNDNDSSVPTSAAVRDYVDNNITAQDLDISDGTNAGSVDLDSQSLTFTGDAGVSATVAGQTVTFDSSALQSQITSNDSDIATLQTDIDTEEAARIAADSTLQSNINSEASTRAAADTVLQNQITSNDTLISGLDTRLTTAEADIDTNTADITTNATNIATNTSDIATKVSKSGDTITGNLTVTGTITGNVTGDLTGNATTADTADTSLLVNTFTASNSVDYQVMFTTTGVGNKKPYVDLESNQFTYNPSSNTLKAGTVSGTLSSTSILANGVIATTQSAGDNSTKVATTAYVDTADALKQDISEKGQANGYAPLDAGAKVSTTYLPDSIVGQLEYQGTWDASTNTPTLPSASTVKGHYYVVSTAGTYLSISYAVGDWIISNGTDWEKVDNTDAVTTVFGRLGAIVANESDYSAFYPLLSDLATTDANVLANTTKLAGIEAGADVTDATNVAAAGALMSGTAGLDDLADVSVPTPSGGQVLTYNGTSGQWEAIAAGAAPVDSVNGYTGVIVLDPDDLDDTATVHKFTTAGDIAKLAGIEAGADITDATNVTAALATIPVTAHSDVTSAGSGAIITSAERTKLQGIETGAQVNTVDSVNTQTGVVVLDADDISDAATINKFTTAGDISKLAGIEAGADVTDAANVTTALGSISVTAHSDVTDAGSGAIITSAERTQLQGADAKYTVSVISTNTTGVKDYAYVLTADLTLTLPATPSSGDKIAVSNMSGTTTPIIARNGSLIAGLAEDLIIDVDNLGIELLYTGATKGWVIL